MYRALERLRVQTSARSRRVRARLVHGMLSMTVTSAGVSVAPLWTAIPGRLLPVRDGDVTSMRVWLVARMPHREAVDRYESTAPSPQASTAASQCPSRGTIGWPTA